MLVKKLLIIMSVLTCLLALVGCDPGWNMLDENELLSNTTKIELVNYENTKPKLKRIRGKNTSTFDFSKATYIATLDESSFEAVIKDIAEQELLVFGRTLNEPIGKTMVLYQDNGNMVVLFGCIYKNEKIGTRYYGYCNIYDENGKFVDYLGDINYDYVDELETKYFEGNT